MESPDWREVFTDEELKDAVVKFKVMCPHCGKSGGTVMYRWHFDACKHNT
jgi:hypothetical protein